MRLPYAAALLMVMGTAQAATSITFAKDDKCTEFQGEQVDVSDNGCHSGRADSKFLSFSGVEESKDYCLVKFYKEDCEGSGMRQDMSTILKDVCESIDYPEGQKSYKLEIGVCEAEPNGTEANATHGGTVLDELLRRLGIDW